MVPGYPGGTLHLEAENYANSAEWARDVGLEGVDYHDSDEVNHGGAYRLGDEVQPHVDIATLPDWSGFAVGWMEPGEWLRYELLGGGQEYQPRLRYARGAGGDGRVRLHVDGAPVGEIAMPPTGGWDQYTEAWGVTFALAPGRHELRLEAVSGGTNVDWIELVPRQGDCPCGMVPGADNFCFYDDDTPGCPMTHPGGYCRQTGGPDWVQGWHDYQAQCGG